MPVMAGEIPFQFETGSACTAASDTLSTVDAAMAEAVRAAVEAEQLRRPGGSGHRQLQRVVEAAGHDRDLGAEPALDLVGDREGEQEVRTAGINVFGDREDRAEVVCRMAETPWRQIRVEQVGIADQHGVEECGLINRSTSATDERCGGTAAELLGVRADGSDQLAIECAYGTGDAVEHVPFQRPHSADIDIGGSRSDHEIGDFVHNVFVRHGFLVEYRRVKRGSGVHDQTPTCGRPNFAPQF